MNLPITRRQRQRRRSPCHPTRRLATLLAVALPLALALPAAGAPAAKADQRGRSDERAKTTKGAATRSAPSDADISDAIRTELQRYPGVGAQQIDIRTNDGVVTLSGSTTTLLEKARAERLAESVKGVHAVVNTIEVRPPERSDAELQEDVRHAVLLNAALEFDDVNVSVENGRVTLTGTVESPRERLLAETIAMGVPGVRALDGRIDVNYQTTRPDEEIRDEVIQSLRFDALVDDGAVKVTVDDARVVLSGTVGSAAERRAAILDAQVAGVKEVDADELVVESWNREPRFRTKKYVERPAEETREALRAALRATPGIAADDIEIVLDDHTATLRGTVASPKARRMAAKTARETVGIWRVRNQLVVRPAETLSDAEVKDRVQRALLLDADVSRADVAVDVQNGVAILAGTVSSWYEKAQAEDTAESVRGVVAVDNDLAVLNPAERLSYHPYVESDWDLYDFDWYSAVVRAPTVNVRSDWELLEEVRDELYWSPFVDSADIDVKVDDGVVQLTGTVATWREYSAAMENAYQAGAVAVDNDLVVEAVPMESGTRRLP